MFVILFCNAFEMRGNILRVESSRVLSTSGSINTIMYSGWSKHEGDMMFNSLSAGTEMVGKFLRENTETFSKLLNLLYGNKNTTSARLLDWSHSPVTC